MTEGMVTTTGSQTDPINGTMGGKCCNFTVKIIDIKLTRKLFQGIQKEKKQFTIIATLVQLHPLKETFGGWYFVFLFCLARGQKEYVAASHPV